MADKNVKAELNEENLEGVAGGAAVDVKTRNIGIDDNDGGSESGGDTNDSEVDEDNIENINANEEAKQNIVNQGRGNKAKGKIRF